MSKQNRAGFNTVPNEDSNAPIIDSLLSTRTGSALSARQGNVLLEMVQEAESQALVLAAKSVTILAPSAPAKKPLFKVRETTVLQEIESLVAGASPSMTFSVRFGPDYSQAGTEVVTGGITVTSTTTGLQTTVFDNAVIPAESWVWLTVDALGGTVTDANVTLYLGPA